MRRMVENQKSHRWAAAVRDPASGFARTDAISTSLVAIATSLPMICASTGPRLRGRGMLASRFQSVRLKWFPVAPCGLFDGTLKSPAGRASRKPVPPVRFPQFSACPLRYAPISGCFFCSAIRPRWAQPDERRLTITGTAGIQLEP